MSVTIKKSIISNNAEIEARIIILRRSCDQASLSHTSHLQEQLSKYSAIALMGVFPSPQS